MKLFIKLIPTDLNIDDLARELYSIPASGHIYKIGATEDGDALVLYEDTDELDRREAIVHV